MKRLILMIIVVGLVLFSACAPTVASPTPAPTPSPTPTPSSSAINWDEAKYHFGERTTVCGPVVGTRWASGSKGKPTFLNIGKDYPDSGRFTVVIWIDYRANFPQPPEGYYLGKTICITGLIEEYKGIPQIEAKDPSQIQER